MVPDIIGPIFVVLFFGAINVFIVLQWLGKLPRGNPDHFAERAYLLFPMTFLALLLVLLMLGAYLEIGAVDRLGRAIEGLPGPVVGFALLGGMAVLFMNVLVLIWYPDWLRPRWQKEMIAEAKRREERRVETARQGGRYVLDVVVDGRVEPLRASFDDLEAAERAARSALRQHAERGEQVYATILDSRDDTAVRIVEQA